MEVENTNKTSVLSVGIMASIEAGYVPVCLQEVNVLFMKCCVFNILRNIRAVAAVAVCVIFCAVTANAGLPEYRVASADAFPSVYPGTSTRLIVKSECLGDEMTVDVWFPPSYNSSAPDGFTVIYAHDGQNLFDPALSFANVAWELDNTAGMLAEKGEIAAPIIVGIHNRGGKNFRSSMAIRRFIIRCRKQGLLLIVTRCGNCVLTILILISLAKCIRSVIFRHW